MSINHEKFDPERKQSPNLKWRDEHIEYGINFNVKDYTPEQLAKTRTDCWFLAHEVRPLA